MKEIVRKRLIFRKKEIWFADFPFDVKNYYRVDFRYCKNKVSIPGFKCEEQTTLIIDLTQSLDAVWNNMAKNCRYEINRAKKLGVKVKINQDYEKFCLINEQFRKKKGLAIYNENTQILKNNYTLFISEWNHEILGGALFIEDKNNIRWLIGSSQRLDVDKKKASLIGSANRLVIWEAIKYAKDKEIKEFDFGGYYTGKEKDEQKEGINIFKKYFGGKLVTRYDYKKDYSVMYKIYKKVARLFKRWL